VREGKIRSIHILLSLEQQDWATSTSRLRRRSCSATRAAPGREPPRLGVSSDSIAEMSFRYAELELIVEHRRETT
jgi:hypothetical protein